MGGPADGRAGGLHLAGITIRAALEPDAEGLFASQQAGAFVCKDDDAIAEPTKRIMSSAASVPSSPVTTLSWAGSAWTAMAARVLNTLLGRQPPARRCKVMRIFSAVVQHVEGLDYLAREDLGTFGLFPLHRFLACAD